MAKIRLDWFKLDCQLDSKFDLIESEFGLKGFAVVVKLYQMIYGGEGYYCEWNDDIALVFARKNNVNASVVSDIVERAIARGIFDERMLRDHGILTSHGIQSRYCEAVDRRKFSKIKPEYLLLCTTQKSEDADISSKNADISSKNVNISTTEKKRTDKKRGDKIRQTPAPDFSVVDLTADERTELVGLSDRLTVEAHIRSIAEWQQANRKKVKAYLTIRRWITEGKPAQQKKQPAQSGEPSYSIEAWEDFAMGYDPKFREEKK